MQNMSLLGTNCPLNKSTVFLTNSADAAETSDMITVIVVFKESAMFMVILEQSLVCFKLTTCSKELQQHLNYF